MTHEEIFAELMNKIKEYHPSEDLSIITKAYTVALDAHGDQLRESGEPYIIHPLWVALILSELELDLESIEAGILHDVIEDTKYTADDISSMFGEEVTQLVDGVTKLDKLSFTSKEEEQAENYRKMLFAMSKDIRVILIKIADRLHNLRTLKFRPPDKQKKVAQETLDIYAPIAHRLGISKLRYEMEDLSFRYLNPDAYYDLAEKIRGKLSEREDYVNKIVEDLRSKANQLGIDARVDGRPKHFFSIYKKMVSKNKTLDQIYDLVAVRIIVNNLNDCYAALGLVHDTYTPVPGRFKDYIALPKSNRYQSLHSTVIGPGGEPFEVQIRTWDMHRTAEYGIAAHWKYKAVIDGRVDSNSEEAKISWLRQIMDWQRDLSDSREFLDALKFDLNIFKNHVYCFSPRGDVITLLSGSTPIDFAYGIHSAVGNKMIGARVNNKIVTFDYTLQSGDRVEIITSQNSKGPSMDWLKLVKTNQARSKINQWFKKVNREENRLKGKDLLEKEAKRKNLNINELATGKRLETTLNRFRLPDWDSLCAAVGHGGVKEGQVINRLQDEYEKEQEKKDETIVIDDSDLDAKNKNKKSGIIIKGVGDINVRFSKCCSPVPGDEVVGFVTRGRGVSIHRTDCINIVNLSETERYRLIEADWEIPDKGLNGVHYRADVRIVSDERSELMMDISRIFNEEKMPIKALNARLDGGASIIQVSFEINSRLQLDKVYGRIHRLPGIREIERVTT